MVLTAPARARLGAVARPWADICRHYDELSRLHRNMAPLAELVHAIAESKHAATGLCGATSLAELVLAPSAAVFDNPHLVIVADASAGGLILRTAMGRRSRGLGGWRWRRLCGA